MHPLLLDVDSAADRLGVSKSTFARRLAAGELVGTKVGSQWRFWAPTLLARITGATSDHVAQELTPPGWIEPGLVDVDQLAELVGLTSATVAELLREGAVPAGKVGRQWRIYWPTIRERIAMGLPLTDPPEGSPR